MLSPIVNVHPQLHNVSLFTICAAFSREMGIRSLRASMQGQMDPKSRVGREVVSVMKIRCENPPSFDLLANVDMSWQQTKYLCCVFTQTLALGLFGHPI